CAHLYPPRLQTEGGEVGGGGHAICCPAAEIVVGVEHLAQLGGWTVHAGRWPLGNRLVHHAPRQRVVGAAHALAHVEEPLEVDDTLAYPLQLLGRDVPARNRAHHPRVGLADEEAEAALGRVSAEDERVTQRGEVLAA